MNNKNKLVTILIYLDRSQLSIFVTGWPQVGSVVLPETMISDLEIKRLEDLKKLIGQIVAEIKAVSGQVFLLLSPNMVFEKNFAGPETEEITKQNEEFIRTVPFDHVKSRVYKNDKGGKIIAVNRDFYESFAGLLAQTGFSVEAVTPVSALPENFVSSGLSVENGKMLLKKADLLREYSLTEEAAEKIIEGRAGSDPRKNRRLLVLILVLVALVIALATTILNSFKLGT